MLTVWCGRISEPAGAECHVRYDLTASHTAKLRERGGVGQLIACHLWLINIVHCDLRMEQQTVTHANEHQPVVCVAVGHCLLSDQ